MRLIIFGLGKIFEKYADTLENHYHIVAYMDNDSQKLGKIINGIPVISPYDIGNTDYDKIVIMSDYAVEMRKQLKEVGVPDNKIFYYKDYLRNTPFSLKPVKATEMSRKAIIITSSVGYHGGAMAAVFLAQSLNEKGYYVTIAAPEIDNKFICEFSNENIGFQECLSIQFSKKINKDTFNEYDFILVNTFPMVMCALEINKYRKVVLWLHECDEAYRCMDYWKEEIITDCQKSNLQIYAVSKVAKKCFEKNICKKNIWIFPYAIKDTGVVQNKHKSDRMSFAIVGSIYPLKQQMLFLEAIDKLKPAERSKCDFYIVGKSGNDKYYEKVKQKASEMGDIKLVGELNRNELSEFYPNLDVLVIPSKQECMPLVATEAMMYGKVCIITKNAGMSEYIDNLKDGIILNKCDKNGIAKAMEYCIYHCDELDSMGRNARDKYLNDFTMEKMKSNLDDMIKVAELY